MSDKNCPFPHYIDTLYGVTVTPIKDLPQTCMGCGATITYAEEVCFVSAPEMPESNDVMTSTPITFERLKDDKEN